MRRFWKQGQEDDVERLLRTNRAEPREEFAAALLERLGAGQQLVRPQRRGRRLLVAAVVTALALGAGVAAGGTYVVGASVSNLVNVGKSGILGDDGGKGKHKHHHHHHGGPGDHQYSVPLCWHTRSQAKPWVLHYVPPFIAAYVVANDPPSYIVGVDGNPDTCPP